MPPTAENRPLWPPTDRNPGLTDLIFTIDAKTGTIITANAAARRALACKVEDADVPISVDRAMPAVQRLRVLAQLGKPVCNVAEHLAFWTPNGVLHLKCRVTGPEPPCGMAFEVSAPLAGSVPYADGRTGEEAAQAKLAHELRTPLSAVISYAEVLRDEHFGPLGNARYRTYAANILESARHVLRLIDGMLQVYVDRSHASRFTFTEVASAALIESCLVLARPLADRSGVELVASLPPSLPHVVADEVSLKQILLNLLANAIKFSPAGGRVTLAATYLPNETLSIAVTDRGPGMTETEYTCGNGTDSPSPGKGAKAGLGFGLPLARILAEANGATIAIESKPGCGTRVSVVFDKDRLVPV
jgi:anti-sigma regulatory factor (Ser/Thr protein kinase)